MLHLISAICGFHYKHQIFKKIYDAQKECIGTSLYMYRGGGGTIVRSN